MNKLTSCRSYLDLKKGFIDLDSILNKETLPHYAIPTSYYESQLSLLTVKKYPLVTPTIKAAKKGLIRLLNFSDPKDPTFKPKILPDFFSAFILPTKDGGAIAFVNAEKKSGYVRNIDKEAVGVKINETALYAYLQTGYTARLIALKDKEVTNNVKLHQILAEMYSSLIGHLIDGAYPISGESGGYTRLIFLLCLFYLQFMVGMDEVTALKVCLGGQIKTIDLKEVSSNSRALMANKVKMSSFDDFLETFRVEFPFIRADTITLRSIITLVIKYYGSAAMFAVEHFQSFLNLVQSVGLKAMLYNDKAISSMVPTNQIDNVNKILLMIGGEV